MEVVGVWEACLVSCASAVLSSELQLRGLEGEGEGGTAHAAACLSACTLTRVRTNTQPPLTATSTLLLLLRCTEEVEAEGVDGGGLRLLHTLHAMLEAALHSPALEDMMTAEVCLAMCERGMALQGDTAKGEGRHIQDTLQVARQALRSAHTCDVWECALDALESSAAAAARESRATAQLAATAARAAREGHRAFSLARTRAHASSYGRLNDEVIELR